MTTQTRSEPTQGSSRREALDAMFAACPALRDKVRVGQDGAVWTPLCGMRLGSRFSRVVDLPARGTDSSVLGWRAQAHVLDADGRTVDAAQCFASIEDDAELVDADRLSRAVHVLNFFAQDPGGLLILPVHERLLKSIRYDHGRFFAALLAALRCVVSRVAVEIPPHIAAHRTLLGYLVESYRANGFRVAAHLANAPQLLALHGDRTPDYLLVDTPAALRDALVAPLVSYATHHGVALIFDRLRDAQDLALLRGHGVRYVQMP